MAGQRFGGPNSPGGRPARARKWSPDQIQRRGGGGILLLYPAGLPLLLAGVQEVIAGAPINAAVELGALGLIWGGTKIAQDGISAASAFEARSIAKPPAIPRKLFGSVAIGVGVALAAALAWPLGWLPGAAMGAIAAGAILFAIGLDPMRAKGDVSTDFERERVTSALAQAEALLIELRSAADSTRDSQIRRRVETFSLSARDVMEAVEDDPRDLAPSRKYLGLYLKGARDATQRYADLSGKTDAPDAKARYLALIDDLDAQFKAKRAVLLEDDQSDLDIEIDVLRHRLAQDGVRTDKE